MFDDAEDDDQLVQSRGDRHVCHAANLIIGRHGNDAAIYAGARTAVLAGEGDLEAAAVWRQITAAVEELQRERRPDETVN